MKRAPTPNRIQTFMFAYNYMQPPKNPDPLRRAAKAAAEKADAAKKAAASPATGGSRTPPKASS